MSVIICSHLMAAATTYGKNILPGVAALKDVAQISDIIRVDDANTFQRQFMLATLYCQIR